jgi:Flp pilus assembly protein TadB
MNQKVEWEIVDEASPRRRQEYASRQSAQDAGAMRHPLQALLGPWWRWKIAGMAIAAIAMLVLLAIFAGVFVLVAATGVLLSVAVAKARRLFGRSDGSITPRY